MIIFEIGKNFVKAIWGTSILKEVQIAGVANRTLKSKTQEELLKTVSSIVDEKLYKKYKPLVLSIPRNQVTLRNLKFPAKDKKELDDIISLHLTQEVPYAREEIVHNYELVEKDAAGFSNVILGIMHRQTLIRQFSVFEKIGLYPDNIVLSTFGVMAFLLKGRFARHGETGLKACIDVGDDFTDFFVFKGSQILFSRSIAADNESLKDNANILKFTGELRQALIVSRVGKVEDIEKLYLTGIKRVDAKFENSVGSLLGIKVKTINLADVIRALKDIKNIDGILTKSSMTPLLGIATDPLTPKFNFVLPEAKLRRDARQMTKNLFVTGGIIIYFLVISLMFFMGNIYSKEVYLNKLGAETKKLQQINKNPTKKLSKIKTIQNFTRYKDSFLYYYYELAKLTPVNITIDRLTYNKKKELAMVGRGTDMGEVFKFVRNLNSAKIFGEAELRYSRKASKETGDFNEFNVSCRLQ